MGNTTQQRSNRQFSVMLDADVAQGHAEDDADHSSEGGQADFAATLEFGLGEAGEVLAQGRLDGGVFGHEGLQHDSAWVVPSAGAACNLGDDLKCALGSAEIRERQGRIAAGLID